MGSKLEVIDILENAAAAKLDSAAAISKPLRIETLRLLVQRYYRHYLTLPV